MCRSLLAVALVMVAGCGFGASLPVPGTADDADAPSDAYPPTDEHPVGQGFRIRIDLDASMLVTGLVDFPVLVSLGPADCNVDFANIQPMGQDLRFYDADATTLLPHEIERWQSGQPRQVWVRVPELLGADHIWMYYGDPAATDTQDPPAVWSNGYLAVWHLDDGNPINSVNGIAATGAGGIGTTEGKVGLALDFDANNDLVDAGDVAGIDGAQALTVTAWVRPTSQGANRSVVDKRGNSNLLSFESGSTAAELQGRLQEGSGSNATSTSSSFAMNGNWGHWGVVFSQQDIDLFYDGAVRGTDSQSNNAPDGVPDMGNGVLRIGGNAAWHGAIDEVRIANTARTNAWIQMEYRSTSDQLASCGQAEPL